jgi:hypothetical protein
MENAVGFASLAEPGVVEPERPSPADHSSLAELARLPPLPFTLLTASAARTIPDDAVGEYGEQKQDPDAPPNVVSARLDFPSALPLAM